MEYLLLLIPLLLGIVLWYLWRLNKTQKTLEKVIFEKHDIETARKEELKNYFEEEWKQEKDKLDYERKIYESNISNRQNELENKYKLDASKYEGEIKKLEVHLREKEKRYNEVNQDLDLYRQGKIKEIDSAAAEYEQRKRLLASKAAEEHNLALKEASGQLQEQLHRAEEVLKQQLENTKAELEVERSKRAAINEEIRRRRQVEEEQDFYKIQFSDEDRNDVEILRSVAPRLRHPEAINKVIWSAYYQKPLAELRKRLLPNGDVSGVYKITRLKTNEIYIGQTTSVDKRWQEHVKSALGVGTLASSQLHRVMAADGCENFTFELLEVVPKDKLRERESYYIDFYDSKTYGLNSVTGDKK